ncbi:MAG: hypothetical protein JJ900_15885 [Rhodospirillales bacterium]|nr:hypothetical protein [Rhodospirillales bacterium]MBO6788328.1 hypothetical protein [Rhodospirillales bacterium]
MKLDDVRIVSRFIDADETPVDYQLAALAYWRERCAGRWAPAWKDVSLADLTNEAIPRASVTDIQENPLTSVYRYWGSELTKVFGKDYTHKTPADVPPRSLGVSQSGGCGRLVQERCPHLEVKEFVTGKGLFGRALVLRMPCSADGEAVTQGINVYYFERLLGEDETATFFDEVFSRLD